MPSFASYGAIIALAMKIDRCAVARIKLSSLWETHASVAIATDSRVTID